MSWWIHFETGKPGCVEQKGWDSEAAKARAEELTGRKVKDVFTLPYPATPQLNPQDGYGCPAFCFSPEQCKGRTCCPKNYACSE